MTRRYDDYDEAMLESDYSPRRLHWSQFVFLGVAVVIIIVAIIYCITQQALFTPSGKVLVTIPCSEGDYCYSMELNLNGKILSCVGVNNVSYDEARSGSETRNVQSIFGTKKALSTEYYGMTAEQAIKCFVKNISAAGKTVNGKVSVKILYNSDSKNVVSGIEGIFSIWGSYDSEKVIAESLGKADTDSPLTVNKSQYLVTEYTYTDSDLSTTRIPLKTITVPATTKITTVDERTVYEPTYTAEKQFNRVPSTQYTSTPNGYKSLVK